MNIVIAANCQATALATILKNIKNSNGKNVFNVIFAKPIYELGREEKESFLESLKKADVLLYQPHKGGPKTPEWFKSDFWVEYTNAKHCVSFASIYFSGYNPELCYLRNSNGLHLNEGLVDYHDRRVVKLFLDGYSPEKIVANINQLQPHSSDIELNLQSTFDEMVLRESSQNLSIKLSDFVKQNYKKERLFYTYNHPSNSVLYEVVKQLISILKIDIEPIKQLKNELLRYDDFPILASVAKCLKLEFCSDERQYLVQNKPYSLDKIVCEYHKIYSNNKDTVIKAFDRLEPLAWLDKKKLIIHIGLSKTGTTSLQRFAFENRDVLEKNDLYYPKTGIDTIDHLCIAQHYNGSNKNSELISELNAELREQDCQHALISCEAFESLTSKDMKQISQDFSEYDIYILCSIRNRLAWLRSMYAEVVKKALYIGEFSSISRNKHQKNTFEKIFRVAKNSLGETDEMVIDDIIHKAFYYDSLVLWQEEFLKDRVLICDIDNENIWLKIDEAFNLAISNATAGKIKVNSNKSPSVLTIELARLYYLDNNLKNLNYAVATQFILQLDALVKSQDISTHYNTHFQSEEELLEFITSSVKDDIQMLRNFNINRSGYSDVAGMVYVNKVQVLKLYEDLAINIDKIFKKISSLNKS